MVSQFFRYVGREGAEKVGCVCRKAGINRNAWCHRAAVRMSSSSLLCQGNVAQMIPGELCHVCCQAGSRSSELFPLCNVFPVEIASHGAAVPFPSSPVLPSAISVPVWNPGGSVRAGNLHRRRMNPPEQDAPSSTRAVSRGFLQPWLNTELILNRAAINLVLFSVVYEVCSLSLEAGRSL